MAALLLLGCGVSTLRAATLVHDFYLPMPEAQLRQTMTSLETGISTNLDCTFSVVVTGGGTVIYYDQWEDGYEINLAAPAQSSTKVWGDGNDLNGIPPGFAHDPAGLAIGTALTLRNLVPLPRNPSNLLFDGRDRIAATKALVVSRMAWPVSPGSVLADAVQIPATIDWGTNYVSPIGQDLTNTMFQYVALFVMAGQDNTAVTIDADGAGPTAPLNVLLNRGESYFANGGIKKGASVVASKPVQAELVVGKIGARYASDWFTLYPVESWGSSYATPVPTPNSGNNTYVFLYNPGTNALTINYTTRIGSGSFAVSSNGVYAYIMPQSSGARFTSTNGGRFFALCTVAAKPGNEAPFDWGFTLLPSDDLTTEAVVGLGLGSSDGTVNGSPVWVAPLAAARLYVDYDGDRAGSLTDPNGNQYDVAYDLVALQSQRIYDPDKDQTGMRVYTIDGTLFSTAWGEDADVAAAGNPYIDAGTTVLPFPVPVIRKVGVVTNDTGVPGLSIGDTLQYTVELDNRGLLPLGNTVLIDAPSANVAYVPGTTKLDGNSIPDNGSGTPFPLDAPGYTIPIILRGGTSTFSYQMTVLSAGVISNYVSAVGYGIAAQTAIAPPPSGGTSQCALNFTDSGGTTVGSYAVNSLVYVRLADADQNSSSSTTQSFTVVVTNVTRGDFEVVTLTETGVNTGVFRNAGGLTSSVSLGTSSQDGTLNAVAGDLLSVTRTDPFYGDTCNATAVIQTPTLTKVLYLSGTNSSDQNLDRINPAAAPVDNTTAQTVSIGNPAGTVVLARTNTASGTGNSMSITNVIVTSASDRMLLVAVGFNPPGANGVTGIAYSGQALSLVRTWRDGNNGGNAVRSELWRLMNPPAGTTNVVLTFTGNPTDITAGAMVFNGVDQTTPFSRTNSADGNGTSASLTIASATNEQVFTILASRDGTAATATGSGQIRLWSLRNGAVLTAGNRTPGASNVTNSWTITAGGEWAAIGVSIKPAAGSSGGTNVVSFPQTPAFCSAFTMPSGGAVTITNFITVTSGSMIANPAITATLRYGSTNFLTLSNPTYTAANSNLVWSGVLSSNTTIPAGQAISFVISNNQSGVGYVVDYDSAAKPSKITLPASTVIHVNTLGVYDAPYPGGSLVASPISGATLYVRAAVSDPFGSYDITSLGLGIDGPGASDDLNLSLTDSSLVASDSCSKTYEYAWHTGVTPGTYNVAVTANEGSEGVTDVAATSVNLTFLDLGTPGTTQFTSGNNGTATNAFPVNSSVCVRVSDTDQNLSSTNLNTITATITSSSGDSETITLTETSTNSGVFTACMNSSTNSGAATNNGTLLAPAGSVLAVTYTDPNDPSDESSATATVLTPPGVPGLTMNKTLLAPTDGQAGVGETVTYNLQVVNSGSTTLTNVVLTDNFPSAKLSFQSASLAPTSTNSGTLTWANLGNFTPGQSTNLTVSFTAIATAAPAVNSATARSTGVITNFGSVGVTITHAALTITKTILSPTNSLVNIGSNVTFRIVVQNTGDTAIPTLPLEDTYSSSCYSNVSATIPPDGTGAGSLLWNDITGAGSLATNDSITIDVVMLVTGGCDPANNTAHADYAVDVNGDPVPVATSTAGVTTGAGRITGYVYNDADQSGTLTGGDTGLDNVNVELYSDPNGDGDPSDGTLLRLASTDLSGAYELLNLSTGAFVVVETDLPGYASVAPLNNRRPVVLNTLSTNANNNFFDYLVIPTNYATINGTVWADTNANGVVDGGDFGLVNVAIDLVQDVNTNGFADLGETVTASTTTDTSGNYSFAGIIPGRYVIRETDLYGWLSTADAQPPSDNQIPLAVGSGATTNGNDFLDFFTGNNPGNDTPVANNDTYSTLEDTTLTIAAPGVLANDTDVDGDSLTTVLVSTTTHGTLTLNPNGGFIYTPSSNYFGPDSFTYRANDGTTNSGIATVNLTVTPVNDPPVAVNDTYTTLELTPLVVSVPGVLTNDTDLEGDALTVFLVSGPADGSLTLNANGSFTYSPSNTFAGADSFTYRATDGTGTSGVATVNITVTPVNDFPEAVNDIYATTEDTQLVILSASGVLTNDSDPNGDPLTALLLATTTHGSLSLNTNGGFTYTPDTNYNGSDIFTYVVTDGMDTSVVATVTINIAPVNDVPVANDDAYSTFKNIALTIPAAGVLTNDTDVENDSLSALLVANVTHGTLSLNANGSFLYTPASNYVGSDVFTYRAYDAGATSGVATVTITMLATNLAPVANNDTFTTLEDTALTIPVAGILTNDVDADGDAMTALLLVNVTHGTLSLNPNGSFIYTPSTNYNGTDSFTYRATDFSATSGVATVTINITPVNDAPIAVNDSTNTVEDVSVTINVLVNDSDPEGSPLTITGTSTTNGTAVISGTNVVFTPTTNFNGTVVFSYTISDGTNSASANVTVTVGAVDDAPVANNDSYSTLKNLAINVPAAGVLTNDTDVENDALSALLVANVTHGTLSLNANGGFLYTPTSNYVGGDVFTYRAYDSGATGNIATVTLTISATNIAPVANNDSFTTLEDVPLTVPAAGVLTNDLDLDGDALNALLVSSTTHGALALNPNGSFTYTPSTNYNGSDSFTYRATDGLATGNVATVTINITPVNDPPIAVNDSTNTVEDASVTINVLVNDSDPEGTPLTITGTSTTNGTAVISGTNVVFTPSTNFNGTVVFSYTVSDGTNSASANVTVTVSAVNDVPFAVNDSTNTVEDVSVTINVLVNDSDPEGTPLTITGTSTTNGTAVISGTNVVFTPTTNFSGVVVFSYTISDGTNSASANVTVTVGAVDDAPVANNDSYATLKNIALNIPVAGVLTNDTDVENDPLSALLVANVTHGTLSLNANGGFLYTPTSNYVGSDVFTYRAYDSGATGNIATVTLNIVATNTPPVANNDSYTTLEDVALTIPVAGILTNDLDIDGDSLSALLVADVIHGTLGLNANGSLTYTPATNYNGSDSFTYRAFDGSATSSVATVTLNITPVNDAPFAVNDSTNTLEDVTVTIPVLVNDSDPEGTALTITGVTTTNGTASVSGTNVVFTPATNFNGSVVLGYTISDGTNSASASITVTVIAVNDVPFAVNDSTNTLEDVTVTIPVLANDSDPEGAALTITGVTTTNGTASVSGTNVVFTPATNFNGTVVLGYTISDGTNSASANITVTVIAVNDVPFAVNDSTNTVEDVSVTINVLVNDSDPEGTPLTITGTSTTNGTAVISGTNVVFTPSTNFSGTVVFSYTISDGTNSASANVTVTVGAINDPPVANPDAYSTFKNTPLTVTVPGVLANDTDAENDLLSVSLATGVSHGILVLNTNGSFTYTPSSNYVGSDLFTYYLTDGGTNAPALAEVSLTVLASNTPPTAASQSLSLFANTSTNVVLQGTDPDGDPLSYNVLTLPAHGSLVGLHNTFTYTPDANYVGTDSFTFRVNDGAADSAIATVTFTILPVADLAVFKAGSTNGGAGTNLTFTITVTNLGPSTASNVVVFDQLPASYTFVSAVPATATVNNQLVSWPAFNLTAFASSNFSITVTPSSGGVFTNVAYATNSTPDLDPTNNNGSSTNSKVITFVQPLADLAVFKTGPASVFSGGSVIYTITVTNRGPSVATNTIVADTLPAGTTLQSASGSYTLSNGVVRWAGVTLASGGSTNYTLTLTAPLTGSLTNIASATSSTPDPDPVNNNGTSGNSRSSTSVTPLADVAVTKTGPPTVTPGASMVYTISVTNFGPVAAANVVVQDLLPTNLVFVSASNGGVLASNVVTWPTILSLANGGATNFTLTVLAPATGTFTNIAFSISDTSDPDPSNNNGSSGSAQVSSAVVPVQFGILQGTNWLNPQTGLFEQRVTVTNRSASTVAAFQLLVGNINGTNGVPRTNVTLVNATGTNVDSRPYLQYNSALNPGSNVTLILEFRVPDRRPFTNSLEVIAVLPATTGTNVGAGVVIDRAFLDLRFAEPRFVLEWTSIPGRNYTIIYSDVSPSGPWLVATPTITAPNNRVQWYDDGPPKTVSKPASVSSRYYRVITNP